MARPARVLSLSLLLLLSLAAAPALATCPPDEGGACSELPDDLLLPEGARPVLTMQAQGVWKHECRCSSERCSDGTSYYEKVAGPPDQGGSYANLTGGGFQGVFYYKISGQDAVVVLSKQGSGSDEGGFLNMPLADQAAFDANTSVRGDVRYKVWGCCSGTPGSISYQEALPLPPIYLATKTDYSEPSGHPPPSEEDRELPESCDSQDPKQAVLSFPYSVTFTFYTC